MGGAPEQVENAVEIGMEHRLGLRPDSDPLHRAQRDRVRQGHQRGPHGDARGRHPPYEPAYGHQNRARNRR
jgi:hypothetical protein